MFWCQGPLFDYAILQNFYAQMNVPVPWNFWQIRDSRTLGSLVPRDPNEKRTGLHNALDDCYFQARKVQQIFQQLEIRMTDIKTLYIKIATRIMRYFRFDLQLHFFWSLFLTLLAIFWQPLIYLGLVATSVKKHWTSGPKDTGVGTTSGVGSLDGSSVCT